MSFTDDQQQQEQQPLTNEQMLQQLIQMQQEHREEVAKLREEVNAKKAPAPAPSRDRKSPEELREERVADIREHSHYCPGCGRLSKYQRECTGLNSAAPHPPIEMVSVEELLGDDESLHTAAPDTSNLG